MKFKARLQNRSGNTCEVLVRQEHRMYFIIGIITPGVVREEVSPYAEYLHTTDGGFIIVPTGGILYDKIEILEPVA